MQDLPKNVHSFADTSPSQPEACLLHGKASIAPRYPYGHKPRQEELAASLLSTFDSCVGRKHG